MNQNVQLFVCFLKGQDPTLPCTAGPDQGLLCPPPNISQLHPTLSCPCPTSRTQGLLQPGCWACLAAGGAFLSTHPRHLLLKTRQCVFSLNTFLWPRSPPGSGPTSLSHSAGTEAALSSWSVHSVPLLAPCRSIPERETFSDPHWERLSGRAGPCVGLCSQGRVPTTVQSRTFRGEGRCPPQGVTYPGHCGTAAHHI